MTGLTNQSGSLSVDRWTLVDNAHLDSLRHVDNDKVLEDRLTKWELTADPVSPFPDTTAKTANSLRNVIRITRKSPERFIEVMRILMESRVWLLEVQGCSTAGQLHDVMDLALTHTPDKNMQAFVLIDVMDRPSNHQSLSILLDSADQVTIAPSYLNFGAKVGKQESHLGVLYTLKQVLLACHVRSKQIASEARRLLQLLQGEPALQLLGHVPDSVLQAAFGHVARDFCCRDPAQNGKRAERSNAEAFTDVIYLSNMDSIDGSAQALRNGLHHGQLVPGLTPLNKDLAVKIDACFHR